MSSVQIPSLVAEWRHPQEAALERSLFCRLSTLSNELVPQKNEYGLAG